MTKSKCDRCQKPLYGFVSCPLCRRDQIAEAVATERARIAGYDANYHGAMQGWTEAKAEIARLRAALDKTRTYARHLPFCTLSRRVGRPDDPATCDCGLAALAPSKP